MFKHHQITATHAQAEEEAAPPWYRLPEGWTWERVAQQRSAWKVQAGLFPLASTNGVTGWGSPLRPQRDRVRIPHALRADHAEFLRTASAARKVPGGRLAARKALADARFWRLNDPFRPAWG